MPRKGTKNGGFGVAPVTQALRCRIETPVRDAKPTIFVQTVYAIKECLSDADDRNSTTSLEGEGSSSIPKKPLQVESSRIIEEVKKQALVRNLKVSRVLNAYTYNALWALKLNGYIKMIKEKDSLKFSVTPAFRSIIKAANVDAESVTNISESYFYFCGHIRHKLAMPKKLVRREIEARLHRTEEELEDALLRNAELEKENQQLRITGTSTSPQQANPTEEQVHGGVECLQDGHTRDSQPVDIISSEMGQSMDIDENEDTNESHQPFPGFPPIRTSSFESPPRNVASKQFYLPTPQSIQYPGRVEHSRENNLTRPSSPTPTFRHNTLSRGGSRANVMRSGSNANIADENRCGASGQTESVIGRSRCLESTTNIQQIPDSGASASTLSTIAQQLVELKKELEIVTIDRNEKTLAAERSQFEITKLIAEKSTTARDLQQTNETLQRVRSKNAELEEELHTQEAKISTLVQDYEDRIADMIEELEVTKALLSRKSSTVLEQDIELARLKDGLIDARATEFYLRQQNEELQRHGHRQIQELTEALSACNDLRILVVQHEGTIHTRADQHRKDERELKKYKTSVRFHQSKVVATVKRARIRQAKLSRGIANLGASLGRKDAELQEAKQENELLDTENRRHSKKLQEIYSGLKDYNFD